MVEGEEWVHGSCEVNMVLCNIQTVIVGVRLLAIQFVNQ